MNGAACVNESTPPTHIPDHLAPPGPATYPSTDTWGRVNHIDARRVGKDLPIADDMRYVDVALDAALLEGHVVLRKGARLVCENVLHLRVPHTQGIYVGR